MRWQRATVTAIRRLSRSVASFVLRLPEPVDFVAGQHVVVRLTAPDGYRAQRSYSIASAPSGGDTIELAIERFDDGEVSPFFHDVVEAGDEIEIGGPIGGHFVWQPQDGGPVLMIGAGSGVVPLVSIARERARCRAATPMLLVFSARTVADAIYAEELAEMAARSDGFQLMLTLTREASPPAGALSRRIDTAMIAEAIGRLPATPRHVYVCGSNAFCDRAADAAIAAGVPTEAIRTERYGI